MAFADSRYLYSIFAKIVEAFLEGEMCDPLIRISTRLSIGLNNSRALHLRFNFFRLSSRIYSIPHTCGKSRKSLTNVDIFFYFHACCCPF